MTADASDALELLALADAIFVVARALAPPGRLGTGGDPSEEKAFREAARRSGIAATAEGRNAVASYVEALRSSDDEAVRADRVRLFDAGQVCPPNETAWIRRDKGAILADIAGFYHAFGLDAAGGTGEKLDHIATELQFVGILLVQRARAVKAGEPEREEVARGALRSFVEDHPGLWIGSFVERLEGQAATATLHAVAGMLRATWARVFEVSGAEAPAEHPLLAPNAAPGTPYECGMCEKETSGTAAEARS